MLKKTCELHHDTREALLKRMNTMIILFQQYTIFESTIWELLIRILKTPPREYLDEVIRKI